LPGHVFLRVNVNRGAIHMIGIRGILRATLLGTAVFAVAGPAAADDMFDVAFGVSVTSDYISRGISQTEHKPAVQGYIEPSVGPVYGGVWASNVSFGGVADTEVDFYAGVRPEIGPVTLDLGYNQATYVNDPSGNAGEFYLKADVAASDNTTVGGQFYVNPTDSSTYIEANADISLPKGFGVSGAVGAVSNDTQPYTTWNAGIYYAPFEWAKIDVRYSATNLDASSCTNIMSNGDECDARLVVGLSIDTSLSALRAKGK
jgi:uncharacterized protein (TIGR02001 family)